MGVKQFTRTADARRGYYFVPGILGQWEHADWIGSES